LQKPAVKKDCNFNFLGGKLEKKNQKEYRESRLEGRTANDIEEVIPQRLKKTYKEMHPEKEGVEKVVCINRTTKVTKGGRKLNFGAVVVVGDKNGNVGCGFGKANEVPDAIKKGINDAKKNVINVPLKKNTIPHEVIGRYGAAIVLLKPAAEGTGVIAGNVIRAICDAAGIKDILTKCLKSQTPANVIKATLDGLKKLRYKNELSQTEETDA